MAIRATNVTKTFRLYTHARHRIIDLLGLLPQRSGKFTEHLALDNINLEIRRGEKVALIGRNGAGKSTLLKLITRISKPSSGEMLVAKGVSAMLQMGGGFHSEFSGRQNAYAYLANIGIIGPEADEHVAEIIEFAELEEYFDQPVRTYSTGMAMRLMFAAATTVRPDILVIDEVLGVGDAYFAEKSFERIVTMCKGGGTTALMVTHDIFKAAQICDRMIWLDRGKIVADGRAQDVMRAYENSVRLQEEARLRTKAQQQIIASRQTASPPSDVLLLEFESIQGPLPSPFWLGEIVLRIDGDDVARIPPSEEGTNGSRHIIEGSCWGEPGDWKGVHGRPILNYGSPFHRGMLGVVVPGLAKAQQRQAPLSLTVPYAMTTAATIRLKAHFGTTVIDLGPLPESLEWSDWTTDVSPTRQSDPSHVDLPPPVSTGSNLVSITALRVIDESGECRHVFQFGERAAVQLDLQVNNPSFAGEIEVLITFHREGRIDALRLFSGPITVSPNAGPCLRMNAEIARLNLGRGNYSVSAVVAREGYYKTMQPKFFSVNPDVYSVASRILDIVVEGRSELAFGTIWVEAGRWTSTFSPQAFGSS